MSDLSEAIIAGIRTTLNAWSIATTGLALNIGSWDNSISDGILIGLPTEHRVSVSIIGTEVKICRHTPVDKNQNSYRIYCKVFDIMDPAFTIDQVAQLVIELRRGPVQTD